jgi:hypothetical protein
MEPPNLSVSSSTTFLVMSLRLLLSVGTCVSFLPSLGLVIQRRRHFEAFVSIFQYVAALMFSASDALGSDRLFLLSRNDWHMISDILTETYICLICIHLMGLKNQDIMHVLRYIAFASCWIAKLADGWGSVTFEAFILGSYILPPQILLLQALGTGPLRPLLPFSLPSVVNAFLDRKYVCDSSKLPKAIAAASVGVVFLALENTLNFGVSDIRVFSAFAHCGFGVSTYYLWQLLPCYDKSDDIPMFK